jgi:hypothetical protein
MLAIGVDRYACGWLGAAAGLRAVRWARWERASSNCGEGTAPEDSGQRRRAARLTYAASFGGDLDDHTLEQCP